MFKGVRMKTAIELFNKYEVLAPTEETPEVFDQHTDCIQYDDFLSAFAEHDKEIIALVDEMINSKQGQTFKYYNKALTELKKKLI